MQFSSFFVFIALKNTIKTVRDVGKAVDHSMTYIVPMFTVNKSMPVRSYTADSEILVPQFKMPEKNQKNQEIQKIIYSLDTAHLLWITTVSVPK